MKAASSYHHMPPQGMQRHFGIPRMVPICLMAFTSVVTACLLSELTKTTPLAIGWNATQGRHYTRPELAIMRRKDNTCAGDTNTCTARARYTQDVCNISVLPLLNSWLLSTRDRAHKEECTLYRGCLAAPRSLLLLRCCNVGQELEVFWKTAHCAGIACTPCAWCNDKASTHESENHHRCQLFCA